GLKRATSRSPTVTITVGAASKYLSGDSPDKVNVTLRPTGRTHATAFSEAHRQDRAVRGSYSGSCQPSSTAIIGTPGLCRSNCSRATGITMVEPFAARDDTSNGT